MTETTSPASAATVTSTSDGGVVNSVKTTSTVKPAWRTSEAWFNFATGLVGAATSAGLIGPGSQAAQLAGMGLMALAIAIHTWSRTSIKNAAVTA
jgi:hypothetical protein